MHAQLNTHTPLICRYRRAAVLLAVYYDHRANSIRSRRKGKYTTPPMHLVDRYAGKLQRSQDNHTH